MKMPSVAYGEVARKYGLVVVWAIVIATFGALRPASFLTTANFQTIFASQAALLILSLGLILPFAAGEYDLSIAGVLSISLVLVGYLNVVQGWPIGLTIVVALAAGLLTGLINAFFVVVVGLDSIVVTLGMGTLLVGAGLGINIQTTGGISNTLVQATRTQILGLPLIFYYGVLLTVIIWYVFSFTPLGRYLFFVGSGRDVAKLTGIPVNSIRAGTLIASALVSAAGGVLLAGWLGASDPNVGSGYLLPAFAAAFLGATAITPGRFNPWGTFVAVYFLVTGITGLEVIGLSGWIEQVFYGASLVIAVTFSHVAGKRRITRREVSRPEQDSGTPVVALAESREPIQ
jgi:ribose transport system permease protein